MLQKKIGYPLFFAIQECIEPVVGKPFLNISKEAESQEYSASRFCVGTSVGMFRSGKITPTKSGQFVTFWKRHNQGPIAPYDAADDFNFLMVAVQQEKQLGCFVFPKAVLIQKGIISKNGVGGKRAFRLYCPWDTAESKQALDSKNWQSDYFAKLCPIMSVEKIKNLFL